MAMFGLMWTLIAFVASLLPKKDAVALRRFEIDIGIDQVIAEVVFLTLVALQNFLHRRVHCFIVLDIDGHKHRLVERSGAFLSR